MHPKVEGTTIVRAFGDLLYTADGKTLIDMFTAHGVAWLGHGRPEVSNAIADQLSRIWITGGYLNPSVESMRHALREYLPANLTLASLASSGMEANEQAIRIARVETGRHEIVGLGGAMHGKSFATAALAWDNGDNLSISQVHRVPAGPEVLEQRTLEHVQKLLRERPIAAVFVEPIHGTSFGWEASRDFYHSLRSLTRERGSLLIYDEVLTGFYRTGQCFRHTTQGVEPDILVFGKACGNGFPVAGVAHSKAIELRPAMLLGSTFSNNALAAAAVAATLNVMRELDPINRVAAIEATVRSHLGRYIGGDNSRLRGAGALWVLTLDSSDDATECRRRLHSAGVCIGHHGRQLRLLPSLIIEPDRLAFACARLSEIVAESVASLRQPRMTPT